MTTSRSETDLFDPNVDEDILFFNGRAQSRPPRLPEQDELDAEALREEQSIIEAQDEVSNRWIVLGEKLYNFDQAQRWARRYDDDGNPFRSFNDWLKHTKRLDRTSCNAAKQAYELYVIKYNVSREELAKVAPSKFLDINPEVERITKDTEKYLKVIGKQAEIISDAYEDQIMSFDERRDLSTQFILQDQLARAERLQERVVVRAVKQVERWVEMAQDSSRSQIRDARNGRAGWRSQTYVIDIAEIDSVVRLIEMYFDAGEVTITVKQPVDASQRKSQESSPDA